MSQFSSIPADPARELEGIPAVPGRRASPAERRLRGRAVRVVLLVLCLVVLNLFDLVFTLIACRIVPFQEENPIARQVIHSPELLIAYKLTLLTGAGAIFIACRRHWLAEVGCWLLCGVYGTLAVIWSCYYAQIAAFL